VVSTFRSLEYKWCVTSILLPYVVYFKFRKTYCMSHGQRLEVAVGLSFLMAAALCLGGPPARAGTLDEILPELVETHNQVKAAEDELFAHRERARVEVGRWYPTLDISADFGREAQWKPKADGKPLMRKELDLTLTQRLWDFGVINSAVRIAQLRVEGSQVFLAAQRQDILLQGAKAYLNVKRAVDVLAFSRQAESNIKKQAELENAMVERGAGLVTDVLQAKVQLAGAEARRVRDEGALQVAVNRYRAVFLKDPGDPEELVRPSLPVGLLPMSKEVAVQTALEDNLQLRGAGVLSRVQSRVQSRTPTRVERDIARENVRTSRARDFFPTFDAVGEWKLKKNVDGTSGTKREMLGKFQLKFPLNFNLGLTAINTLRATRGDLAAMNKRLADTHDQIEEQTRNSWENLKTAKENAEILRNQANIAFEFLEFARKERKLGRRSLLDVLSGETALWNASSDATSAETDVAIAFYTLLELMAKLDLKVFSEAKPPQ